MSMNMGMAANECQDVAEVLKTVLADTYTLYLKTQNYHWNVTGPLFPQLHGIFEEQYQALAAAIDEVAERIRALGEFAPASYSAYSEFANIDEDNSVPSAEAMVAQLLDDHETMVRYMRESFAVVDEAGDEVTADLFTQRMAFHEKTAWMLRAMVS
jgi:starvation-inducible DNA-binding protein